MKKAPLLRLILTAAVWSGVSAYGQKLPVSVIRDSSMVRITIGSADRYFKSAKYDSAIAEYIRVAAYARPAKEWKTYVKVCNSIAESYRILGKYDAALACLDTAEAAARKELGEESIERADILHTMGTVYWNKTDYDRSLEHYDAALKIRMKKLGEKTGETASTISNIGMIYYHKGYYDLALEYYERGQKIRMELFGPSSPELASVYINTAVVYRVKGDYEKAFDYNQKALALRVKAFGEKHPRVAVIYQNLGIISDLMGDYERALGYHNKALAIRLETVGAEHPDVANSYNDIGILYYNQGEIDLALDYAQKALSIRTKIFDSNSVFIAMSYNNIGNLLREKRRYAEAMEYYQKALVINDVVYRHHHTEVARAFFYFGGIYHGQGNEAAAERFYLQAVDSLRAIYGDRNPLTSHVLLELAKMTASSGQIDRALSYAQQAIAAVVPMDPAASFYTVPAATPPFAVSDMVKALKVKAGILEQRYVREANDLRDLQAAMALCEAMAEMLDDLRHSYKAEGSKLFLGKESKSIYETAIRISLRLYAITKEDGYLEKAFQFSEKSKGGVLLEAITDADAKRYSGIPDSLLKLEKELRIDLAFYEMQLQKEIESDEPDSVRRSDYESRVFALHTRYDRLIARFEKENPDYYRLKFRKHEVSVKQIQESLNQKTAMVEYFVGDSSLYVFVVSSSGLKAVSLPKQAGFDSAALALRRSLPDLDFKTYVTLAREFYNILIAPAELKGYDNWIVVPDGVLNYVPFDALLSKDIGRSSNPDFSKLPYLINDVAIRYAYTGGTVSSDNSDPSGGFIGFAPVFSDSQQTGYIKDHTSADSGFRDIQWGDRTYPELPFTEKEVTGILRSFDKKLRASRIYVHAEASESNFKSENLARYRYIHIASHGFINENNPRLSGIIFARPDSSAHDDGVLYAGEVYNLNLRAELVALSACKSGRGKVVKGEGIMGLTRGFIYSGAKNVLVSLWQLGDESASELMIKFYEYVLAGNDLAAALRKAKLDFIRQKKYAYPADWGGFVLIGR